MSCTISGCCPIRNTSAETPGGATHGVRDWILAHSEPFQELVRGERLSEDEAQSIRGTLNTLVANPDQRNELKKFIQDQPALDNEALTAKEMLKMVDFGKKLEKYGLDPAFVLQDYKGIEFLMESRLIYALVGFRNSTRDGVAKNPLQLNEQGHLEIKSNGHLVTLREMSDRLTFNKEHKSIASKDNLNEYWTYVSGQGLVQHDRLGNDPILPSDYLSVEELADLRQFLTESGEPVVEGGAIVQLVTHAWEYMKVDEQDTFFSRGINKQVPMHASLRIIYPDGRVYSSGLEQKEETRAIFGRTSSMNMVGSSNESPNSQDYDEFQKGLDARFTTCKSVSLESADAAIDQINHWRAHPVRYNLMRQNCSKYATSLWKNMTGEEINNRCSIKEIFADALPRWSDLPVVGGVFHLIDRVSTTISGWVPECIKKIASFIFNIVMFIPNKIGTFFLNLLARLLGGQTKIDGPRSSLTQNEHTAFPHYESVTGQGFFDLFNEENLETDYSSKVLEWQLKRQNTFTHPMNDARPSMCMLPPTGEELVAGQAKLAKWNRRFDIA